MHFGDYLNGQNRPRARTKPLLLWYDTASEQVSLLQTTWVNPFRFRLCSKSISKGQANTCSPLIGGWEVLTRSTSETLTMVIVLKETLLNNVAYCVSKTKLAFTDLNKVEPY